MTTNLINGMRYIGMHYGELDDNYLGSGNLIQLAVKKYGKENFKKEILAIAKTEKENAENEKRIIKEYNAVEDRSFYNIHEGGFGGDTWSGLSEEKKDKLRKEQSLRNSGVNNPRYGAILTEETKEKIRRNRNTDYMLTQKYHEAMSKATSGELNGMFRKHHTEASKQKMSISKQGLGLGAANSNAKKIIAYLDAEHTKIAYVFDCIQDALKFVGTNPKDYTGISKRMKINKPYKGFYWVKGVETNIEEQR